MNETAARLRETVRSASVQLARMSGEEARRRPVPGKWSPIEIVGHLVDSASNNHQRLVRGLFRDDFVFEGYEQDDWVDAQHYREAPWPELVAFWLEYNLHLARVVDATPTEELDRPRMPHSLHRIAWQKLPENQPATIAWWFGDYLGHLEHHLRQISPDLAPR